VQIQGVLSIHVPPENAFLRRGSINILGILLTARLQ